MRRIWIFLITMLLLAAIFAQTFAQSRAQEPRNNVVIRFNGGGENNKLYIGENNTMEILIANDKVLQAMAMGFEFECKAGEFRWVEGYGDVTCTRQKFRGIVKDHGGMGKAFNMGGVMVNTIQFPKRVLIGGISTPAPAFPKNKEPKLMLSMQVHIDKEAKEMAGGFCVDNIFFKPGGTWEFNDGKGALAPDFQGVPNTSESNPDAPPVCFDVVKRK